MEYSYHHPHTEIRETQSKGIGLFSTGLIQAGEVIVVTGGLILPLKNLSTYEMPGHPFQVETDLLIAPFDLKRLDGIFVVNHSCSPNAGVRGQCSLVAMRTIQPDEEICYDYCMTDSDPAGSESFSLNCLCGSSNCRARVTDLDWRHPEIQKKYRGYFSSYIQARIDKQTN